LTTRLIRALIFSFILGIAGLAPVMSEAGTISLGFCPSTPTTGRCATLTDAVSGVAGTANATVTQVEAAFGGDWTEVGSVEVAGDPVTHGMLTINFTEGQVGAKKAAGTWAISSAFDYGDLAISMHVGNSKDTAPTEPDHFIWLVLTGGPGGPFNGTWTYDGTDIKGGGLSNIKAYGRNAVTVTEPGTSVGLLFTGLAALAVLRRFAF
jgi:hypothetical protein